MVANRVKSAKVKILRAEFESVTMKETDEMEDFYIKLSGIVTYIRMLGEDMAESNVVKKLLRVVPSKFVQIASTIEQFGDMETISLEEVVGRLKAHEERVRAQIENTSQQLLLTQEDWLKRSNKNGDSSNHQRRCGVFDRRGRGHG
ncbi:uncharacterized protein LOC141702672 [Apium graveolens]|uniref:uncharacterized protein LOC141702672 n=1 Tax=Apium graveolens TaxID=4045 RepID=UPI003D7A3A52